MQPWESKAVCYSDDYPNKNIFWGLANSRDQRKQIEDLETIYKEKKARKRRSLRELPV